MIQVIFDNGEVFSYRTLFFKLLILLQKKKTIVELLTNGFIGLDNMSYADMAEEYMMLNNFVGVDFKIEGDDYNG